VPRKKTSTLNVSNSHSVHTSIFPIVLYKSYSVAGLEYVILPTKKTYLPLAAFAPDLRRALFHSVVEFLHHSTTTKLIPLFELNRG
jgi:hypothetical protein